MAPCGEALLTSLRPLGKRGVGRSRPNAIARLILRIRPHRTPKSAASHLGPRPTFRFGWATARYLVPPSALLPRDRANRIAERRLQAKCVKGSGKTEKASWAESPFREVVREMWLMRASTRAIVRALTVEKSVPLPR